MNTFILIFPFASVSLNCNTFHSIDKSPKTTKHILFFSDTNTKKSFLSSSHAKQTHIQSRPTQTYTRTHTHSHDSRLTSAYLCAKCKVLFDTITVYDEHLESCKNSNENYNFDEVLEKLANTAQQSKDINASSTAGQQTASIIVVTAAIASTAPSSMTYSTSNRSHTSTVMSASSLAGPSSSVMSEGTATIVTGVATIQMPSSNLKLIKYPRMGHQSI